MDGLFALGGGAPFKCNYRIINSQIIKYFNN